MDYNIEDLLINCLSWNIPLLNGVLKYMTKEQAGKSLSISSVLEKFNEIKSKIGVTDKEFLMDLSRWQKYAPESIKKDNIQTIIPSAAFFEHSVSTKTELTSYLNKTIIEAIAEVDTNLLYESRNDFNNDYWWVVVKYLISTEFMKSLPNNINDLGKMILKDVATNTQTLPIEEPLISVIEKLDKRTTKAIIKDIKNDFCNDITQMSAAKFTFFADWLEKQGDLTTERAGGVCSKILKPVISDNNCLGIILDKADFYSEVINNAGDEAYELKTVIEKIIKDNTDTQLNAFAERIGIKQEEPSDNEKG